MQKFLKKLAKEKRQRRCERNLRLVECGGMIATAR